MENSQTINSQTINFNNIALPKCPFLWNYENQYLYPIIDCTQVNFADNLDNIMSKIIDEDNNLEKLKKFKMDYFEIKQNILLDNDVSNKINISFHSWYYSKISRSDDMTKVEFNIPIETCIVSGLDNNDIIDGKKYGKKYEIKSDEILIGKFTKRKIRVHDKKLSPANSNTFYINLVDNINTDQDNNIGNQKLDIEHDSRHDLEHDSEHDLEQNQIDFYSICSDNKIKKCAITHHILLF